jgi:hypothetical protein
LASASGRCEKVHRSSVVEGERSTPYQQIGDNRADRSYGSGRAGPAQVIWRRRSARVSLEDESYTELRGSYAQAVAEGGVRALEQAMLRE